MLHLLDYIAGSPPPEVRMVYLLRNYLAEQIAIICYMYQYNSCLQTSNYLKWTTALLLSITAREQSCLQKSSRKQGSDDSIVVGVVIVDTNNKLLFGVHTKLNGYMHIMCELEMHFKSFW